MRAPMVRTAGAASILLGSVAMWLFLRPDGPAPAWRPEPEAGRPAGPAALPADSPASPAPAPAPVRLPPPRGLGLAAGDRLRFRFSRSRRWFAEPAGGLDGPEDGPSVPQPAEGGEGRAAPAEGGREPAGTYDRVSGVLFLTAIEEGEAGWLIAVEAADLAPEAGSTADGAPAAGADLGAQMAGRVFARLSSRGQVRAVAFPPDMSRRGRGAWLDLLACWMVVLPEDRRSAEWVAEEEDQTGSFRARYAVRPSPAGEVEVRKAKLEYASLRTAEGDPLPGEAVADGRSIAVFDPLLRRADGDERVRVRPRDFPWTIESDLRFSIERDSFERLSGPDVPAPSAEDDFVALASAIGSDGEEPADGPIDDPEGDGREALLLVEDLFRDPAPADGEAMGLLARLVPGLRGSPEVVRALLDRLREIRGDEGRENEGSLLIAALRAAGTPAAQAAIAGLAGDPSAPDPQRFAAIFSLLGVARPIAEIDPALIRLVEEGGPFADAALLAWAAMAGKVREEEPARFEAARSHVGSLLARGDLEGEDRRVALLAWHNLHTEETPEAARQAIADFDPTIRMAAVDAVASSRDAAADEILAVAIADPDDSVRERVVEVLAACPRDRSRGALEKAAVTDESDSIRSQALAARAKLSAGGPEADPALEDLLLRSAKDDPSESVRSRARALLGLDGAEGS